MTETQIRLTIAVAAFLLGVVVGYFLWHKKGDLFKTKSVAHSSSATYTMYSLGATTSAGIAGNTSKNEFFAEFALI